MLPVGASFTPPDVKKQEGIGNACPYSLGCRADIKG
jgi:hypothetical protein